MRIQSQVFLRDDLHNILRALSVSVPAGEYGEGYLAALVAVATATGMEIKPYDPPVTVRLFDGIEDTPWAIRAFANLGG